MAHCSRPRRGLTTSGVRSRHSERHVAPIHMPFFFEAAILAADRSPVTSRSNWARTTATLRVSRPIELVGIGNCLGHRHERHALGVEDLDQPGKIGGASGSAGRPW